MSDTASATIEPGYDAGARDRHSHGRKHRCGGSRASWSAWEIGLMVAAFVIFWPVGLVILFWKLTKGDLWRGSSQGVNPWARFKTQELGRWPLRDDLRRHSGNSAFEDYKSRELERLEEERRKLADEQRAFGEFLERLKRAKDQDEFDRFMSERRQPPAEPSTA